MRVLFCSAEVAPFAKVGGLADVAGSLPQALVALGHDVTVCMPAYGMVVQNPAYGFERVAGDTFVRVNGFTLARATLYTAKIDGVTFWLIDHLDAFAAVTRSEEVYSLMRDDYIFFAQAAMEICQEQDWWPDVVHAHDWHMGLVPVLLRETRHGKWDDVATAFTIHNLAYQGEFGFDTLDEAGLSHDLFNMHKLEAYGAVNFLKSGCVFADQVNTVSPTYAQEITTPEYGCRLEGLMQHLTWDHRLRGILNGIDVHHHDPQRDPELAAHFSADDLAGKQACRHALHTSWGWEADPARPLAVVISRLSNQKGFNLILEALPDLVASGARLAVLGTGDPWAAGELRRAQDEYPDSVRFIEEFNPPLAQRMYGGSDIFLMPSAFEPCGLGQMFAMRYGSVPVVRRTGGLADTVHDGQNGFVFEEKSAGALANAFGRAVAAFREPATWAKLQDTCMRTDFSWDKSAKEYVALYEAAIRRRRAVTAVGSAS